MKKLLLVLMVAGCGVTVPIDRKPPDQKPIVQSFDAAACADALAHQAELANDSPAFKASELLDGILTQGVETGIPKDFAERVRKACPAIVGKPSGDISADQVEGIRKVR